MLQNKQHSTEETRKKKKKKKKWRGRAGMGSRVTTKWGKGRAAIIYFFIFLGGVGPIKWVFLNVDPYTPIHTCSHTCM
jgi:hypothetical protein